MYINIIKNSFIILCLFVLVSCHSKNGNIPSDVMLQGLKGDPQKITEKSYANDSLFAINQPETEYRILYFNQKGEIVTTMVYSNDCLSFFSEKSDPIHDTLITKSFLIDSTQISVIKQWKTSDSTYELHEFLMEEGEIVGEISSIKTCLNRNQQPEIEEIITSDGYKIITENIYTENLLLCQRQQAAMSFSITISYRYLKFDDHNNWILRQCLVNNGYNDAFVSYQEREIEYYSTKK
ncbi:MAG: hypothetical protein PHR53_01510 [Bacteroidales bacterium]|nr:hypothetical protein [Bacteroidales bacterium]